MDNKIMTSYMAFSTRETGFFYFLIQTILYKKYWFLICLTGEYGAGGVA